MIAVCASRLAAPVASARGEWRILLAAAAICALTGCATIPYEYIPNIEDPTTLRLGPGELQIERGKPVVVVDALGHYLFSLPSKIILWNWRVDNHDISVETEGKLRQYLQDNNLNNVKIRLNQYAPGAEWRRLGRNNGMPGFFRYVFGGMSLVYYTILPGRLLGGDHYNPYTNTINLFSDHRAIALHEAGHAKDFALRPRAFRGWYSLLRSLPLIPLYQEALATGDAIAYDRTNAHARDEKNDYKILYPAFCTYIAGEGLQWVPTEWWMEYAIQAVAVIPGHIYGRIKAAFVRERPERMLRDRPFAAAGAVAP